MKTKKIAVLFLALTLLVGLSVPTAAVGVSPRWAYMSTIFHGMSLDSDGLYWGSDCIAYDYPELTHTKVAVTLHINAAGAWTKVGSSIDSGKVSGRFASVGKTLANYTSGVQYRTTTYAYVYNGSTLLETVGPLYSYYTP